ncbi:hypothetical protein [Mycoplasma sp. 4079]|uniref:hypothetical protein n=1 Tax=Mycoplasma sp. 4079 TaxID=3398615 RepID=UPI0039FC984E
MKQAEIKNVFEELLKISTEEKFIFSLFSSILSQIKEKKELTKPIQIVIDVYAFLKLKNKFPELINISNKMNKNEKFLPIFSLNNTDIILNLLIQSTDNNAKKINLAKKIVEKENNKQNQYCHELIEVLFSQNPNTRFLISRDKEAKLVISRVKNLNPNYYDIVEFDDLKLPYFHIENVDLD